MNVKIVAADVGKLVSASIVYETAEQFAGINGRTLPEDRRRLENANLRRLQQHPAFIDFCFQTAKSVGLLWAALLSKGQNRQAALVVQAHREAVIGGAAFLQQHGGYVQIGQRFADAALTFHALEHTAHDNDQGNPHLHTHLFLDTFATTGTQARHPVHLAGLLETLPAVEAIYTRSVSEGISRHLSIRSERRHGRTAMEIATISDHVIATTLPGTLCRPTDFRQLLVPPLA